MRAAESASTLGTVTSPHLRLLLCCARTQMDAATAAEIKRLLAVDLDWSALLQTAQQHGVLPLLYHHLNQVQPEVIPTQIRQQLQQDFFANTLQNLQLSSELIELLQRFQDQDIAAIPFKGPVLAASVYGNLALRPSGDLDILVPPEAMASAQALLESLGYELTEVLGWQRGFSHRQRGILVELHQLLVAPGFTLPQAWEGLWERAQTAMLTETGVPCLHPEDLLLFHCASLARDCFECRERLIQICDIASLLALQPEINYPQLMARAVGLGYERMLLLGMRLAQDLLGAPLDPEAEVAIQADPKLPPLAAQMVTWLFQRTQEPPPDRVFFYYRMFFYCRVRGIGPWAVIAYVPKVVRQVIAARSVDRTAKPQSTGLSLLAVLQRPGQALSTIYHGERPMMDE